MISSIAQNDNSNLDPRWQEAMNCFDRGDFLGALRLYEALAADGEDYALVEVGNIYELGNAAGSPNFEEAAKWYRKAIFQVGDPKAHLALARIYFNRQLQGDGAADAFIRHATAAAERGEPVAWLLLGVAFDGARFDKRDRYRAAEYYERAAASGMVLAQRRLAGIAFESRQFITAIRRYIEAMWNTFQYAVQNTRDPRLAGLSGNSLGGAAQPHNHPMQPTTRSGG